MKSKTARILCVVGAAFSALFLIAASAFPTLGAIAMFGCIGFVEKMTQIHILSPDSNIGHLIGDLIISVVYGAPAALFSGCLWFALKPHRRTVLFTFISTVVIALAASILCYINYTEIEALSAFRLILVGILSGAFGCMIALLLYDRLAEKMPAVFNRETVSYIVFGVLTTVVSFVSQMLFASLGTPAFVNTIGSWICAVAFAYVVNKLFVFCSHTATFKAFLRELWLFVAARLASLAMELVFMVITVDLLHFSEAVCKIIAQVFILVANYIFSKLIIFKKSE